MKAFTKHKGKAVLLDRGNIDTDQIIPKEHLKSIVKTGFDKGLFSDWRYNEDGSNNPTFELNKPENKEATILLTGNNFGCGSSREHAVWALVQYGFCAIIAPKIKDIPAFADIFTNNSGKNGLLLVELTEDDFNDIKSASEEIEIDLKKQNIVCGNIIKTFEIDSATKERLLKGLDDIGTTLIHEKEISTFEKKHNDQMI